jgi:hypothetical protein
LSQPERPCRLPQVWKLMWNPKSLQISIFFIHNLSAPTVGRIATVLCSPLPTTLYQGEDGWSTPPR